MNNVILVGNNPQARIHAFGDDSVYRDVLAYAYAIFQAEHLEAARHAVQTIKAAYAIPAAVPLHMRVLTNPAARRKAGLENLTTEAALSAVSDIVSRMNDLPFLVKAAYTRDPLPPDDEFPDETMRIRWSEKGMLSFIAKFALIPLNLQSYSYTDMHITVASDATRTPFLGKQARQAASWISGFSDVGAPSGMVYKFEPSIVNTADELLLQVADLIVYSIAHAFAPQNRNPFFPKLLTNLRNVDVRPFQMNCHGLLATREA